jgi:hypothetical protein
VGRWTASGRSANLTGVLATGGLKRMLKLLLAVYLVYAVLQAVMQRRSGRWPFRR